jgi:membrane fusion protein, heavy metal efflux system
MNTAKEKQMAMKSKSLKTGSIIGVVVLVGGAAFMFQGKWLPQAQALISSATNPKPAEEAHSHEEGDSHGGHDHSHEGHDEASSLELSPQARKNVGLTTAPIKLQKFVRNVAMPAFVVGRPGRSHVEVTAVLGGRVTRVYPIEGEAVTPGQPLFDLRLTHEELVQAQSEFLRTAEELDVVAREIARLNSVNVPGAIAGKTVRQREYEQQKLKAVFNARQQSLLLHGLTQEQISGILDQRTLVQGVTVVAPEHPENGSAGSTTHPFTVRELMVKPGQYVDAGSPLCLLVDYGQLYVQGQAFEQDADELVRAAREGWEISATRENNSKQGELIKGLRIVYVDNEVEPDSRALRFYVGLSNEVVHESKSDDGHRFLTWKFKPGQRLQLRVPVEEWPDRIVLPIDAVAKEGAEFYVFQQNGDHLERTPVQVEYQDQFSAVIANDGSVFPGDTVAMSGAHQLQMALKNKSGGGVDPHAGHNH